MSAVVASRTMVCVPRGMAPKWMREWADDADGPYEFIAKWCDANGHPGLASSLTKLYQQLRARIRRRRDKGQFVLRFASVALNRLTRPTRRGCKRKTSRANLRRAHVRLLGQMGLLKTGRGWVEFVDVSEVADRQSYGEFRPLMLLERHKEKREISTSCGWKMKYKRTRQRIYANNRGAGAARCPSGRFCLKEKKSPKDTCASPAAQPPPEILPQVSLVEEKTLQEPPKGASVARIQAYLAGLHEQEQKQARQCEARAAEAQERAASNAPRGPCGTLQELLDVGYRPGFNTRHRLPERDLLAGLAKARRKYPGQNYLGSVLFNAAKEIHAGRWRSYRPKRSPLKARFGSPRIVRKSELTGFSCDMPAPDGLPNDW